MSDVESYFTGSTQSAQAGMVGALDDDPETAARAAELSSATGVPSSAIYGDVDGFERNHKAALGSEIIAGNGFIAGYLNSHPLAPRISNDDLGQLDTASRAIGRIPSEGVLQRATRSFKEGFGEFSDKAILSDPFLRSPSDVEYALQHPLAASITMGLGSLVAAPLTLVSKFGSGVTSMVNEFGGHEAAAMLEYFMMRGDIKSSTTSNAVLKSQMFRELQRTGDAVQSAAPWLRAGKDAPTGVHPDLDKIKTDQAKADVDALSDALAESVKSATRDRSGEFYANFARQHVGDQEVGISADKIRELYGDKDPVPGDNILGWVPGLAQKLVAAETTGGDVKVPLADMLGHIDPAIFKELKDDIRVRPDGITVEEGRNLETPEPTEHPLPDIEVREGEEAPKRVEAPVITEPHTLLRAHAGLEPMFSIGDRKLALQRTAAKEGSKFGPEQGLHDFDLLDEKGQKVGSVNISEQQGGKQLYIDMIQGGKAGGKLYDPNFFGPALVRDLLRQLRQEFPNAETITGHRVSGAREKADSYMKPSASPIVPLRMENLGDTESIRRLFADAFQSAEIYPGIQSWFRPPEDWMAHEHQIADAIQSEFKKLLPKSESRIVDSIEENRTGSRTQAMYVPDKADPAKDMTIFTLMSKDAIGDVHHEAIHQLRRGFFTHDEWDTLRVAALENNWHGKYGIEKFYSDSHPDLQIEESVAEAFRNWMKEPKAVPEEVHPIFQKLKEFFDRIKEQIGKVLGREFTWDEIFQKVASGEVGSREQGRDVAGSATVRQPMASRGDIPNLGGKEADTLREQIAKLTGDIAVDKSHGKDLTGDPRVAELKEAREQLRSITSGTFGMSVDQYNRYMSLIERRNKEDIEAASKRALEQQRRTQTKEWKENRTVMRDTVREEFEGRADLAVDQLMSAEKVKFHPDALTEEQKATLPKEFIQKKNGIAPDDIAGYFGFHSGDALVDRLAMTTAERKAAGMNAKEWMNHLIDTETDRRMEAEHGNLDQRIVEEAKDQAISETQLNLLHEEVLHLGLKAGSEFPISKAQIRAWNKEIFDKTPISGISTDEYLRIAGKAGKAAELSLLKEDFADAFREKQRQNNAMIMASYAKAYEKARKQFDRTAKTFQKREVPSVSQEWTNWIHDILQRTGNRVNRSVQDLQENIERQSEHSLKDFVEAKEAETFGLRETPVADFLLDPNFRADMKSLTAEQFAGLKDSIDVLAKQGRDEKKIYAQGEAADRDVVLREMREKLGTFPEKPLPDERGRLDKMLDRPRMFMAGLTNIETLMNRWDRADPRGIFNRYISYPMAKAANYKSALEREYARAYAELGKVEGADKFVEAPFADPLSRSEANPEGRPWPGFTRKHVLAMLQNAGNKSNWKVLAKGYSADPEALMQWLHQHTTKEDWDRAQKMGDTIFHSLVSKADTVYENLTGATIEKIPLEPIETPFGTYAGWYHPLIADPLRKEVWVKDAETGQWQRNATGKRGSVMDDSDYFHASTANGYTKRRTGAVYPLDLNFDVVPSRIKQMIHDIAFRDTIIQTEKIFGNKAFQAEVTKHYGPIYTDLLMPYLKSMAGTESIPSKAGADAARISEYFRQNVISTYIGFNPYTSLKHGPTALVMSMNEVGPGNFLSAVKSLYGQSPELGLSNSEFAMKHSEELQRRERHWQDTIAGAHNEIEGASTLREKVIEKGSWLVAQSDMLSAKPTWVAQYNKSIGEGLSHGEAVDLADRAVRRAHGSTAATNQPALVRGGGPLHGWLTSVYGFFGTAMQRRIEIAHQLNDTYQLGKAGEINAAARKIPGIARDIMTYVIWPTLVEEWVTGLNTDDKRGLGQRLISGATMGISSSVLYLRDLVHGLSSGNEPGVGLLSSALHDVKKAATDISKGREAFSKAHAGKTVGDILTVFGEGTGMAPKIIGNATRFGIDLVNKQTQPKTAADYARGLTRGTTKKREEK